MNNKVYVVEHRHYREGDMECDIAHLASSKTSAAEWCKNNPRYSDDDFWWAIYEMYVDCNELLGCNELHFRSKDGKTLKEQPTPHYFRDGGIV